MRPTPKHVSWSIIAAMAGLAVALPAAAQTSSDKNWIVNCTDPGGKRTCTMMQNLVTKQNDVQQRLLTVIIQRSGENNEEMLLALPHGLFLPAGVQLAIDQGQPSKLVIQTSDANGAYAGTALSAELLLSMKKGQTLKLTVQTAQKKDVTVPVTLSGFSKAYQELQTEFAKP